MTSSRVSLHDCTLDLRLPILSHTTSSQTAEKIALQAAANPYLDHTEAYTGSTILLLLTVSVPNAQTDPTQVFLQHAAEPHVNLLPPAHPGRSGRQTAIRLPVLMESSWQRLGHRSQSLVKSVWVLIRTPFENSAQTLSGRHDLCVTLRERVTSTSKNSPVWATIDRASRLFGKTAALQARKPLLVSTPVDLACHLTHVAGSADRPIVTLIVRNSTSDADVLVSPPYVNFSASKRLSRRAAVTLVEPHPAIDALDRVFEAVPLFQPAAGGTVAKTDVLNDGNNSNPPALLSPREVFNFTFCIERRKGAEDISSAPVLQGSDVVQTAVTVLWKCSRVTDTAVPSVSALRKIPASGFLMAGGKREHVGVQTTFVEWKPVTLLVGVVVTFSGPIVVRVGRQVFIYVTVVNRTEAKLRGVKIVMQNGGNGDLLALRSVVSVGVVERGGQTGVQIPCVALKTGAVVFGGVSVICDGLSGRGKCCWVSESQFHAFAVDAHHGDESDVGDGAGDGDDAVNKIIDSGMLESLVVR